MNRPPEADTSLNAFVKYLLLAGSAPPAHTAEHLQRRRARVASQRAALEQAVRELAGSLDEGQRMAFDYALTVAAAEIDWLDRELSRLSERAGSGEDAARPV